MSQCGDDIVQGITLHMSQCGHDIVQGITLKSECGCSNLMPKAFAVPGSLRTPHEASRGSAGRFPVESLRPATSVPSHCKLKKIFGNREIYCMYYVYQCYHLGFSATEPKGEHWNKICQKVPLNRGDYKQDNMNKLKTWTFLLDASPLKRHYRTIVYTMYSLFIHLVHSSLLTLSLQEHDEWTNIQDYCDV